MRPRGEASGVCPKVELIVEKLGGVPEGFVELVRGLLSSFYCRCGTERVPSFVEVVIYESRSTQLDHLARRAEELGVAVIGEFPVFHEAWSGWPRIHVSYEACAELDEELLESLLAHEAAHTILHGSREYYLVPLDVAPESLTWSPFWLELVYLASTVVKDLEVHKYMADRGLLEHLRRYATYSAREASGLGCSHALGVLNLAKLASVCLFVDCEVARTLEGECREKYPRVLRALGEILSSGADWLGMLALLLRRLPDMT